MRKQRGTLPSLTTLTLVLPDITCETDILAIFSLEYIISEMKEVFFFKFRQIPLAYMRKLKFGGKN